MTEACHLASKQLEELMDDDCSPVLASNGRDPMLSSPHGALSVCGGGGNDVMSSPASASGSSHSSHYSTNGDDALSDTMDLAGATA